MAELRRLRYFLAVAGERNFTRAAERLHIAQPALSRQIRQLEEELGVELVRRTTHTFELTEAGEYLYEHGALLLSSADSLWRTMRSFAAGGRGLVTVAYGASAAYETAPRLLRGITDKLGAVEIETRVMGSAEIMDAIAHGAVDIGVVRHPPRTAGIQSRLLRLERQGVLMRRDHTLAAAPGVALADLRDEPVLLHARDANPGHYDAVVEMLESAGVRPELVHRDLTFDLGQAPIAEGQAVSIVGESSRSSIPEELTWVPLTPVATLEVRLVARRTDPAPVVAGLLAAAEEVADDLGWRSDAAML